MSTITPSDPAVLYSPYNWHVSGGVAKTICGGAYWRVTFAGDTDTLTATFDVSNMATIPSRVGFRVDNGSWQDFDIAASINIAVPSNNSWSVHTVEMVVITTTEQGARWNAPQSTAVIFTGLTAPANITSRLTRPRSLQGLAIGDSITEGIRALLHTGARDTDRNDSRVAHALPLADLLGAEVGVVGFGGTGISKSGAGGVPRFADSVPYLWAGQPRDLNTPSPPDFVVAHIGTNDAASSAEAVAADTARLLNYLIAALPEKTPIIVLPGWLQTKADAIQVGIAASAVPGRITFVDTTGWWNKADAADNLHPYGYVNTTDLAPRLAAVIREHLQKPEADATPSAYSGWIKTPTGKVGLVENVRR